MALWCGDPANVPGVVSPYLISFYINSQCTLPAVGLLCVRVGSETTQLILLAQDHNPTQGYQIYSFEKVAGGQSSEANSSTTEIHKKLRRFVRAAGYYWDLKIRMHRLDFCQPTN